MFTLFTGCHVAGLIKEVLQHGGSILGSNFVRNILTNISTLGQRTHLKLGELSSLFIVCNITIFYFIRCMVFDFIFYCMAMYTLYTSSSLTFIEE